MSKFKLDNEQKIESGYKIPANYFTEFTPKVLLLLEKEKKVKVVPIIRYRKKIVVAIAAIFILALSIPFFNIFEEQEMEIDSVTLDSYISNNVRFSDEELAEFLSEKDLQKLKIELPIEDKTIENILSTNADIEQYIYK